MDEVCTQNEDISWEMTQCNLLQKTASNFEEVIAVTFIIPQLRPI